ncbi:MAG: hypothetical protein ABSB41_00595 [Anaerolineales bacterium]
MKSRYWLLILPLILLAGVSCYPKGSAIVPPPAIPFATVTSIPPVTPPQALASLSVRPGSISGYLSYPGDYIPELRVVAFAAGEPSRYYYADTVQNQSVYQILNIPAGSYHVIAYRLDPTSTQAAGYSRAVLCGLLNTCMDHTLLDVSVAPGQAIGNVDPGDWYAPAGTYPPRPGP